MSASGTATPLTSGEALWVVVAGCWWLLTGMFIARIGRRRGAVGGIFKAAGPRGWAFLCGGPFLIALGLVIVIFKS